MKDSFNEAVTDFTVSRCSTTHPNRLKPTTMRSSQRNVVRLIVLVGCLLAACCHVSLPGWSVGPSSDASSVFFVFAQPDACRGAEFPAHAFSAQPDDTGVYLSVDSISDDGFTIAGLTKFVSVFGVKIVGVDSVPDYKLLYAARVLAKLLDNSESGKPTNPTLVSTLNRRNAILGFVEYDNEMNDIFRSLPPEYACVMFIVLEEEGGIVPNGMQEPDCPMGRGSVEADEALNSREIDRTIGFISDFVIQSGYPTLFSPDSELGRLVESAFYKSVEKKWFKAPQRCDENCQKVSFQSWSVSSALGVHACSCRLDRIWKLCTAAEMRIADPELYSAIMEDMETPTGRYSSKATIQ
eukprot:GHVQ01008186.1.p1 GENE.GHVQ01008186.1~~GHVQ01008186.1.p1  ORF type:complete len:353 (-),score=33.87 GHVQ01008186.1:728-1786(-)